jgi:hypothetical protein
VYHVSCPHLARVNGCLDRKSIAARWERGGFGQVLMNRTDRH